MPGSRSRSRNGRHPRNGRRRRRRRPAATAFDRQFVLQEGRDRDADLDDAVALAGRVLAEAAHRELRRKDARMAACEQLLTSIQARGNAARRRSGGGGGTVTKLINFHSETLMLGGGESRAYLATARARRALNRRETQPGRAKTRLHSPIQYRSPLLAPVANKRRPASSSSSSSSHAAKSGGRKRRQRPASAYALTTRTRPSSSSSSSYGGDSSSSRRPQSAAAATAAAQQRRRLAKAATRYAFTGDTGSYETTVRPFSSPLPSRALDNIPWRRLHEPPARWRASWEPSTPLTYTPQDLLDPVAAAASERKRQRRKKKTKRTRRARKDAPHWALTLAQHRRRLLAPVLAEQDAAARRLQRFFTTSQKVGIRDRWRDYQRSAVRRRASGALSIQRVGRGMLGRRRVRALREASRREQARRARRARRHAAAATVQRSWRIVQSRRRVELFRKVVALRKKHSARKLQRMFKRKVGRRAQWALDKAGAFGKHAVLKMQGLFRGKLARRKSSRLAKARQSMAARMKNSAVTLQSAFRGMFARRAKRKQEQRGSNPGDGGAERKTGAAPSAGSGSPQRRKKVKKKKQKRRWGFGR